MIVFYVQNLDETHTILEEDEFVHCIKVLRHKLGDIIELTDGKGNFAKAKINSIAKRSAELEILDLKKIEKKSPQLILAVAPPKSKNRWDFLIEKAVEAGVDRIIPFTSKNSERQKMNFERAEKLMRSAALQSKRIIHPKITELMKFEELLSQYNSETTQSFIAHFSDDHRHILQEHITSKDMLIIVGPEGDFTPEEFMMAKENSFIPVNISENRLRTETAAIVAVSLLRSKSQMKD
jgi:16S rRNA (uracil1498-N3)-methyltransferase